MISAKYALSAGSTLAAILSLSPRRFAIAIALSGRFSGEIRPRNAR